MTDFRTKFLDVAYKSAQGHLLEDEQHGASAVSGANCLQKKMVDAGFADCVVNVQINGQQLLIAGDEAAEKTEDGLIVEFALIADRAGYSKLKFIKSYEG